MKRVIYGPFTIVIITITVGYVNVNDRILSFTIVVSIDLGVYGEQLPKQKQNELGSFGRGTYLPAKAMFCGESLYVTVTSKTRLKYFYIDKNGFDRNIKPIMDQLKQNAETYNDMMKLLV
jgi:hypothetical protein